MSLEMVLKDLSDLHPDHDVALNAHRLIPKEGYLVEYDHWGINMHPQSCVAFWKFSGKHDGTGAIDWSQFTHEDRRPL